MVKYETICKKYFKTRDFETIFDDGYNLFVISHEDKTIDSIQSIVAFKDYKDLYESVVKERIYEDLNDIPLKEFYLTTSELLDLEIELLSEEEALEIAKIDYEDGIYFAMGRLEDFGFNCSVYFDAIDKAPDCDYDDCNIQARDLQYKLLGIYDIMQKAYEKVEA